MIAKMPLENFLVIDIETVSAKQHYNSLSAEWQQLWEDKVNRTLPEDTTADQYYPQRAGVMAEFSKVVCISLGYFKKENSSYQFRVKSIFSHVEKELLQNFITTINQLEAANHHWSFTGHNIKEFDIPFLCRRLLINGIPIPAIPRFSEYETLGNQYDRHFSILAVWRLQKLYFLKIIGCILKRSFTKGRY